MKSLKKLSALIVMGLMLAVAAQAGHIQIPAGTVYTTSQLWTSNNTYDLLGQVHVADGATLTIEPGTIIASTASTSGAGALNICRGGTIIANGTCTQPIIFTSSNDDFKTWRAACLEWGSLSICGKAIISGYKHKGSLQSHQDGYGATPVANTALLDGVDKRRMEGLTADATGDPKVLYGGDKDDDDSGSISYVSLRYGGRVVGVADELNGMSLGGVGRETDIHHVEIMNNVDDGIEIFGGTVNLKYTSIWNVGDDYFDIDQGWRGKGQFIMVVQGYSAAAKLGSGVGQTAFEMDGSEDSDGQPTTVGKFYNVTAIGQTDNSGGVGQATAWRDNCRVQFHNSIFMDFGGRLVWHENTTDGSSGYGYNGTLSWNETWTSPYTEMWNTSNSKTGGHANANGYTALQLQGIYPVQTSGNLAQISNCVFYNVADYGMYDTVSALPGANNVGNIIEPADMPIKRLIRGEEVEITASGGPYYMYPVVFVDPRAVNSALTAAPAAPADGFFTPVTYRGAFSANENWLLGWTAAAQYGLTGGGVYSSVDTNGDCTVDLGDFVELSNNWLMNL